MEILNSREFLMKGKHVIGSMLDVCVHANGTDPHNHICTCIHTQPLHTHIHASHLHTYRHHMHTYAYMH